MMEDKKTAALKVLTEISDARKVIDGSQARTNKEPTDSPHSIENKKQLQKKNQLHPLFGNHPYRCASMYGARGSSNRPKLKDISQRIVSAKLLQIKELRNELTLTQHQLNEVANENRFLKTLQKRQEVALRKYEGHEARLPQLIQSHNEELRILTSKLKQLKITNQRLVEKLKCAEQQLSSLQEQHCHLVELSRDQALGERETLAATVRDLQHTVSDQNNMIQLLTRKVDLERKNYKHELGNEKSKRNEIERKLSLAMQTIENLKDQIEAKEKCMSAIVPSRYVRTSQGLPQPSLSNTRLTHSQIPRTPHTVESHTYKISTRSPRKSSTDQTSDETDILESCNGNNTSDSTRTLSGTTLPKIKPPINNRNLKGQLKKLSNKRNENASTNKEVPDYSSSFTSTDMSLKDLRQNSESESEKMTQAKRQFVLNSQRTSSRARKFSVDSGVMNKSESGKMTQRTNQSDNSNSKTRRNSISGCTSAKEVDDTLQQECLASKMEATQSIKDELRELEEKLLQGSSFLNKTKQIKSFDVEAEETAREMCKGTIDTPRNMSDSESDREPQEVLDDDTWNDIHNRIKAESDAAEAKLEEYYNTLEKSELNLEDTENYIALEEEQKEKLLKALKEIDKETLGGSSGSSSEGSKSSIRKPTRRKSDAYNFSKNVNNLHKGQPVYEKVKIPVVEKMRREEKEYLSDVESGRKNKADFMKDLFGNFDSIDLHRNSFSASKNSNKDMERLVQMNRSFD